MGSVGKKLGKVFKKVVKAGKQILPIALPVIAMMAGGPAMANMMGGTAAGGGLFGTAAVGGTGIAGGSALPFLAEKGLTAATSGLFGAGGMFAPMKGTIAKGIGSFMKNPLSSLSSQKGLMALGAIGGGLMGAQEEERGVGKGPNMAQPMYNSWARDARNAGYSLDEFNDMYSPYGELYGGDYTTKSPSDYGISTGVRDQFPGTNYPHKTYTYANGGRVGLAGGGKPYESWKDFVEPLFEIFPELIDMDNEAQVEFLTGKGMIRDDAFNIGGRVGYNQGDLVQMASSPDPMDERNMLKENLAKSLFGKPLGNLTDDEILTIDELINSLAPMNQGGRVHKNIGGIMNAPAVNTPGQAMMPPQNTQWDGRAGGFMPMGVKPRADDVPAMLSKDEFVMTRDAVKGMGGGDPNIGAQKMYDLMNNLEANV